MPNTIPEISFLLKEVERKYGREVHTSTDFDSLSVVIEREINEYISSATLKRLWGYVSLRPAPRDLCELLRRRFLAFFEGDGGRGIQIKRQTNQCELDAVLFAKYFCIYAGIQLIIQNNNLYYEKN